MKISVIGTGYVGLVTGTCFAETGIEVHCVDIDKEKIEKLRQGISPIYEPGLDELIVKNIKKNRLFFTTNIEESLQGAEAVFISVGTPPDEDGSADLQHVLKVATEIGRFINDYIVVVTKSTVPVGTAEKVRAEVQKQLSLRGVNIVFDMASNPEFLKEGDAINDFMRPDRIVIGIDSPRAEQVMRKLYKPFLLNNHPILFMDIPSAELTKYAANAMLATRISFMNEIALLCEKVGADINNIRQGIGSDSRIGNKFLYAGVGYGGSCFPKDVKALIYTGKQNGISMSIIDAVEKVNDKQKSILFDKLMNFYNGDISGKTIAIWGLAFKPNTDDMREAPSLVLIEKILQNKAKVKAYDPIAMDEARRRLGNTIELCSNLYEAIENADALILVTEWNEFRNPRWDMVLQKMRKPVVLDGRNIYEPQELINKGFKYFAIGRKIN